MFAVHCQHLIICKSSTTHSLINRFLLKTNITVLNIQEDGCFNPELATNIKATAPCSHIEERYINKCFEALANKN